MKLLSAYLLLLIIGVSCAQQKDKTNPVTMKEGQALATFGSGCFWCTEAVFQRVNGVELVTSGYMGGKVKNPGYKEVTTGLTGHAEVTQLVYDPSKISFDELLEIFWGTHDPTTLNRQGADVGTLFQCMSQM